MATKRPTPDTESLVSDVLWYADTVAEMAAFDTLAADDGALCLSADYGLYRYDDAMAEADGPFDGVHRVASTGGAGGWGIVCLAIDNLYAYLEARIQSVRAELALSFTANLSATLALGAGVATKLTGFDDYTQDDLNEWDPVTGRLTSTHGGLYHFDVSLYMGTSAGGDVMTSMVLYKNGVLFKPIDTGTNPNTWSVRDLTGSGYVHLSAGDYIEIYVVPQNSQTLAADSLNQLTVVRVKP